MLPGLYIHCFFCHEHPFHLCLPSKQTPTHLSKFSSSITFSVKSFSHLDFCPSRMTTLLFMVYVSQHIQHKAPTLMYSSAPVCSLPSLPSFVHCLGCSEVRKCTIIILTPQYQHFAIDQLQKERKQLREEGRKQSQKVLSTQKYISHLLISEHLSCYYTHPNLLPLDFCNSLFL